jgi:hypothetical protein
MLVLSASNSSVYPKIPNNKLNLFLSIMKKLLLTIAAVVSTLVAGSGTAWAFTNTETMGLGTSHAKNSAVVGTSFTIDGTYVAERNSESEFRLRCQSTAGVFSKAAAITVNEGYTINSITITGISMSAENTVTLKEVYVDDATTTNLLSTTVTFPISTGKAVSTTIDNLNAKKTIYLVTDGGNVQLGFQMTVNYTTPEGYKETSATLQYVDEGYTFAPASDETKFFSASGVALTGLKYKNTQTYSNVSFRRLQGDYETAPSKASSDCQAALTIVPTKGYTFIPTAISYDAALGGGATGNITAYMEANGTTVSIVSGQSFSSSNTNYPSSKTNISGLTCTSDVPLKIYFQVYKLPTGTKYVCISNVKVEGYFYGEDQEVKYTVATSVYPEGAGTISQSLAGTELPEESAVTFTAKPNTGYAFVNWTVGEKTVTSNPYEISSLSDNVSLTANFEALPTITFAVKDEDENVQGDIPAVQYGSTTIASNQNLYKEGYTLTGWSDGADDATIYTVGQKVETTEPITLWAVFTKNDAELGDLLKLQRTAPTVVKWNFVIAEGAKSIQLEAGKAVTEDSYVTQTTVNGSTVDLVMNISASASGAKFSNSGTNAQTKAGVVLNIPVCDGAVVTVSPSKGTFTASVTDKDEVLSETSPSFTYNGDAKNVDITFLTYENLYLDNITITYPKNAYAVAISDLGAATLSLSDAVSIPEGVTAYTGELSEDNATLKLVAVEEVIPAAEPVIIFGEAGNYTFPIVSTTATKSTTNSLKANLTEAVPSAENAVVCVLNKVDDKLGFYKLKADTKLGANKAYLPVPTSAAAAPAVRIAFGDEPGNVTGIESIAIEQLQNAPIFNLAGQKVQGRVAPGLYIQGGKKILVK